MVYMRFYMVYMRFYAVEGRFYMYLCVFMRYYVILCVFMCVFMRFYAILCDFMCFCVILCDFIKCHTFPGGKSDISYLTIMPFYAVLCILGIRPKRRAPKNYKIWRY